MEKNNNVDKGSTNDKPKDRKLVDCYSGKGGKGGKGGNKYYYGFISHLDLWNSKTDSRGLEFWYTAADGRSWPRPICAKKHNIQAHTACDDFVDSVQFRAVHLDTGKTFTRVSNSKPYVMFGINGRNVADGSWTAGAGKYNVTITPFNGPDATSSPGFKMMVQVTLKGDC